VGKDIFDSLFSLLQVVECMLVPKGSLEFCIWKKNWLSFITRVRKENNLK